MMYTMPKNLLSICVNFTLATQHSRSSCENVNSKCEKNIKKYNQASRANSSRHSANTISAVFQPNISRG